MKRLDFLDFIRGLIIILMALDHASALVARVHFTEIWGVDFSDYPNIYWWFTRFVTHFCAPGFFLLMGIGMALFREKYLNRGWSEHQLRIYFIKRALVILGIMLFLELPAWGLGSYFDQTANENFGFPGIYEGGFLIPTTVLYGLALSMFLTSFLQSFSLQVLAVITLGCFLLSPILIDQLVPSQYLNPATILCYAPGITKGVFSLYPIIPWLGFCLIGFIWGRRYSLNKSKVFSWTFQLGLAFLSLFLILRFSEVLNFQKGAYHDWISFFTLIKYPPSLCFSLFTLGVLFVLIFAFRRMAPNRLTHFVFVFGQTAMFFYITHLFVYGIIGAIFPMGCSIAKLYLIWIIGLSPLYYLCKKYLSFKRKQAATSFWKMI